MVLYWYGGKRLLVWRNCIVFYLSKLKSLGNCMFIMEVDSILKMIYWFGIIIIYCDQFKEYNLGG